MSARPVPAPVSDTTVVIDAEAAARILTVTREHRLTDVRAELLAWRAVDRMYTSDTDEFWDATLRLRDIADRAESETRA